MSSFPFLLWLIMGRSPDGPDHNARYMYKMWITGSLLLPESYLFL